MKCPSTLLHLVGPSLPPSVAHALATGNTCIYTCTYTYIISCVCVCVCIHACTCVHTVCTRRYFLATLIVSPSFLETIVESEEEQTTPTVTETSCVIGEVEGAKKEERGRERKWFGCVVQ